MDMEQAQSLFINEAEELLAEMERCLLEIEEGEAEVSEHIDAIFRAAHTIKGSAGLFGFDSVVAFTHNVENVLDQVRAGRTTLDASLLELMLDCHKHMEGLIHALSDASATPSPEIGDQLLSQLEIVLNGGNGDAAEMASPNSDAGEATHSTEATSAPTTSNTSGVWRIHIQYGEDVLRDGMDPCSQLRFLETLGTLVSVNVESRFPEDMDAFDPESCYLTLDIAFDSDADRAQIEEVFEFIYESSDVQITEPKAQDEAEEASEAPELSSAPSGDSVEPEASIAPSTESVTPAQPVPPTTANPAPAAMPSGGKKASSMQFLKVDSRKLDHLISLIGELVTSGAANDVLVKKQQDERLLESFGSMLYLVEQIRDGALGLRMVQVGESFNRLKRIVRDVSKELGKSIDLEIHGAETELDKTMVEKLSDPLMHIIRNAIDHGIEPTSVRQQRGKPDAGKLMLNAFHEAGAVVIEIIDDGAGLNADKLRARAIERGVISADAQLTEEETYKLVFEPGFSTAEAVTNLSGRGVGMDVVKRNIEELRGQVSIESELEKGTTFRIRVPLTLAIIDGFQVQVSDKPFVIPVNMIQECLEFTTDNLSEDRDYLNLRNEVLPFVRLRDILQLPAPRAEREHVVVVQFGQQKAGLIVDELHGELQAVIKPMNEMFRAIRGIGGTTILGTGDIGFIVDVPQLIELASSQESQRYGTTVTTLSKGEA